MGEIDRITRLLIAGVILAIGNSLAGAAAAQNYQEEDVKAVLLYNIARYSEWRALEALELTDPFNTCFLHRNKMAEAMEELQGRTIHGHALQVRYMASLPAVLTNNCQILYLSEEDLAQYDLEQIAGFGIATAASSERFLDEGGAISILRYGEKLGFSISRSAMEAAGVTPSSRMLKLAREIR